MLCSFKATIPKLPLEAKKKKEKTETKTGKRFGIGETASPRPREKNWCFWKNKNILGNKDSDLLNFRFFSDSPVFPVTLNYHTKGRAIQLSISWYLILGSSE